MPLGRPEKIEVNDQGPIVCHESNYFKKIGKVTMIKRNIYTIYFRDDSFKALFFRNHFAKHYEDSSSDEVQYDSDGN